MFALDAGKELCVGKFHGGIVVHFSGPSFGFGQPSLICFNLPFFGDAGVELVGERDSFSNGKKEEILAD